MPRKYLALWERIKVTGTAKVVASPNIHIRIMKAVQKEKLNDTSYKITLKLCQQLVVNLPKLLAMQANC